MSGLTTVSIKPSTLTDLKDAIHERYGELIGRIHEEADKAVKKHAEDLRGGDGE